MDDKAKYLNGTTSQSIKTGDGSVYGFIVNSHTTGTIEFNDGATATEAGDKATGTLTLTGVITPGVLPSNVLTSTGALVPGSHATSEIVSDATNVTELDTITIDATVYRLMDTMTQAYDVQIGASAAATLDNVKAAINASGTPGTEYFAGTSAHPGVVATTNTDTVQTIVARVPGTTPNAYATTETSTHLAWADTTLGGGTGNSNPGVTTAGATFTIGTTVYTFLVELSETSGAAAIVNQVIYGGSEAVALDNMKVAINGGATEGTNYSTGTVARTDVIATTNTNTAQTIISRTQGVVNNDVATTETLANTTWADTTLGGGTGASVTGVDSETATVDSVTYSFVAALTETSGATAVINEVLFGADSAAALDNFKLAINKGATEGTNYSTGTVVHPTVTAETNANDSQVVQSKVVGTASNSIVTTEDITNGAWGGGTLSGGTEPALLIMNTFSPATGSSIQSFPVGISFYEGLYVNITGTIDYTILYK